MELISLDNATGRREWHKRLPAESPAKTAVVLSARPFTLWFEEGDERGTHAVLAYDDMGRQTASLPLSGPDHDLAYATDGFKARPVHRAAVIGGTFVTAVQRPGELWPQSIAGYSLRDGHRLWLTDLSAQVAAIAVIDDGHVAALTADARISTITTDRGGKDDGVQVRDGVARIGESPQLARLPGGWLLLNPEGTRNTPPALAAR